MLDGDPPFEQKNGGIVTSVRDINDWWIKLGLLDTLHDPQQGIDCSLMAELSDSGFRQALQAQD